MKLDVFIESASQKAIRAYVETAGCAVSVPRSVILPYDGALGMRAAEGDAGILYVDGWWAKDNIGHLRPPSGPLTAVATMAPPPPSSDQVEALRVLMDWAKPIYTRVLGKGPPPIFGALVGAPGTGKSTVLAHLINQLQAESVSVVLGTPTGRAAAVLRQQGMNAETLHRHVYGSREDDGVGGVRFGDVRPWVSRGMLGVVDEATMVTPKDYEAIIKHLPHCSGLLLVGDTHQLSPVTERGEPSHWPAPLDTPTAQLTQVHRQGADGDLLPLIQAIRAGVAPDQVQLGGHGDVEMRSGTTAEAAAWVAQRRRTGADAAAIVWTNDLRNKINRAVRHNLGRPAEHPVLEDRVLIRRNNYTFNVFNGEVYSLVGIDGRTSHATLARIDGVADPVVLVHGLVYADPTTYWNWTKRNQPSYIGPSRKDYDGTESAAYDAWLTDYEKWLRSKLRFERVLQANYGEASTAHSAQGGAYDEVLFGICRGVHSQWTSPLSSIREAAMRIAYVACSRARKHLVLWHLTDA